MLSTVIGILFLMIGFSSWLMLIETIQGKTEYKFFIIALIGTLLLFINAIHPTTKGVNDGCSRNQTSSKKR